MERDHNLIEKAIDFYFDDVKALDREADLAAVRERSRLVAKIPKDEPLIFKPFGRPFCARFMHVKRKRYIVPKDLRESVIGSEIERFLRKRWVTYALVSEYQKNQKNKKKRFEHAYKVRIIELLPSIMQQIIAFVNEGRPKKERVRNFDLEIFCPFFSLSRSVGKDYRNISYDLSVIATKRGDYGPLHRSKVVDDMCITKQYPQQDLINKYSIPTEEEEFYMMLKEHVDGRLDKQRVIAY